MYLGINWCKVLTLLLMFIIVKYDVMQRVFRLLVIPDHVWAVPLSVAVVLKCYVNETNNKISNN